MNAIRKMTKWKPTKGEPYFIPFIGLGGVYYLEKIWINSEDDIEFYNANMVFRTVSEAVRAAKKIDDALK